MPIPSIDQATGNLPAGIHDATWEELDAAFGSTPRREELLEGLLRALSALQRAGCRRAYVDGSFVTSKDVPGDFDACWDAEGVDPDVLDATLLDFDNRRAAQKAKYGGELFIATDAAGPAGMRFLDFFQRDKRTGDPKGIVALDLGGLP
jgi:uncharacterized protein DUF6932